VVEVVGQADAHAALRRVDERGADGVCGLVAEPDVVEREVEGRARGADEIRDRVRDLERRLAAVRQEAELEAVPPPRVYRDSALRLAL
jgi:hypothetical protein